MLGQLIFKFRLSLFVLFCASVAVMTIGLFQVWLGVPDNTALANDIPAGKAPDSENVTVPWPPVAAKVIGP